MPCLSQRYNSGSIGQATGPESKKETYSCRVRKNFEKKGALSAEPPLSHPSQSFALSYGNSPPDGWSRLFRSGASSMTLFILTKFCILFSRKKKKKKLSNALCLSCCLGISILLHFSDHDHIPKTIFILMFQKSSNVNHCFLSLLRSLVILTRYAVIYSLSNTLIIYNFDRDLAYKFQLGHGLVIQPPKVHTYATSKTSRITLLYCIVFSITLVPSRI